MLKRELKINLKSFLIWSMILILIFCNVKQEWNTYGLILVKDSDKLIVSNDVHDWNA